MRYRLLKVSAVPDESVFERVPKRIPGGSSTDADDAFQDAVLVWLRENIGAADRDFMLLFNYVRIKDPDDALAFKMRWC